MLVRFQIFTALATPDLMVRLMAERFCETMFSLIASIVGLVEWMKDGSAGSFTGTESELITKRVGKMMDDETMVAGSHLRYFNVAGC